MNWTELRQEPTIVSIGQNFDTPESFSNAFNKAYVDSFGKTDAKGRKEFVEKALHAVLETYSETEPKTKGGRVLRFISKVLSKLNLNIIFKKW